MWDKDQKGPLDFQLDRSHGDTLCAFISLLYIAAAPEQSSHRETALTVKMMYSSHILNINGLHANAHSYASCYSYSSYSSPQWRVQSRQSTKRCKREYLARSHGTEQHGNPTHNRSLVRKQSPQHSGCELMLQTTAQAAVSTAADF